MRLNRSGTYSMPIDKGFYECWAMYDEDNIVGYAFLACIEKNYFIDYLAVFEEKRNHGIGGEILGLLRGFLSDEANIILEAEDPDHSDNLQQKKLQERRIAFYKRHGWADTSIRVTCFGVPFVILALRTDFPDSKEKIIELYKNFYRNMLTAQMFGKNIRIDE